ncbi:MAG TPA: ABC transporter permease [Thermoanaerobaculia bacterium]|nr:ABC transporter permease [Thermoanaerobaculia bacterium]
MRSLARDLRQSLRTLSRRPLFLLLAVTTLALGIGAGTAIFSAINAVLFRAMPYPSPDELVFVWSGDPQKGTENLVVSYPDYISWKEGSRSFQDMAVFNIASGHLTGSGPPEELWGAQVSVNFFSVLDVKPLIGGGFSISSADSEQQEILLGHGLWQRRFGGDPSVVGSKIFLSGKPYTVVGVMPPEMHHPEPFWQRKPDFWRPFRYDPEWMTRGSRFLRVVARLKPGTSPGTVQAEISGIAHRLEFEFPDTNRDRPAVVVSLREQLFGNLHRPLLILLVTASLVLLIACANVANLQLTRALSRQREIAVRAALGAGPIQVVRSSLAEGLILAFAGGALGLALAFWGTRALVVLSPTEIPGLQSAALDGRVLAFALAVTAFTALVTGVLPAFRLLRPDLRAILGAASRTSSDHPASWARNALAVSEIALALPLLVAAGLLTQSTLELNQVDLGFRKEGVLTFRLPLPSRRYPEDHQVESFYSGIRREIAVLPGVRSVALVSSVPLAGLNDQIRGFMVAGATTSKDMPSAHYRVVGGDYFQTMGIPLLDGRPLSADAAATNPPVAAASRTLANRLWPGMTAVGRRIRLGDETSNTPWIEIVGVVEDIRDGQISSEPGSVLYVPHAQDPLSSMAVVVRASRDPETLIRPIRRKIWERDPELPVADVQTVKQIVWHSNTASRFHAFSVAALAALALCLALVGVLGVIAYQVGERRREFGIRAALGARRPDLVFLVLRQAGALALSGSILGLGLALLITRLLHSLLYQISSTEPAVFAGAAVLLLGIVLLASLIPARKATQSEPIVLLHEE